ncbi:hypothetical protein HD554DRAFT_2170236 [Boletus coccyginus]|nr:hypothetical protein HD554DRAFT_2170236 [Boletus coccyginus]
MYTLIIYLMEIQDMVKISPIKENLKDILEVMLERSNFIQTHLKRCCLHKTPILLILRLLAIVTKSFVKQIAVVQFRSKLDVLQSVFSKLRDNFKDAIASQIAIDIDAIANVSYLEDILKSVPLVKLHEHCINRTHVDCKHSKVQYIPHL